MCLWAASLRVALLSVLAVLSPLSTARAVCPSSATNLQDSLPPTYTHRCLPPALGPRSRLLADPLASLPAPWTGHSLSYHQPLRMLFPPPGTFSPLPFPPFSWDLSPQRDWPHNPLSGRVSSQWSPSTYPLHSVFPPGLCSFLCIYN